MSHFQTHTLTHGQTAKKRPVVHHTHLRQSSSSTSAVVNLSLYWAQLDSSLLLLLWKLWDDLTLIEVSSSRWSALTWDVLQMYLEWSMSNYREAKWKQHDDGQTRAKKRKIAMHWVLLCVFSCCCNSLHCSGFSLSSTRCNLAAGLCCHSDTGVLVRSNSDAAWWCPGSLSVFQFIPKVSDGVEVRVLVQTCQVLLQQAGRTITIYLWTKVLTMFLRNILR